MKLFVVGFGGCEYVIVKKLLVFKDVDQVFVVFGNDGMILDGLDLVNIGIFEYFRLIDFVKENEIVWIFIGFDDVLVVGIVDGFNSVGFRVFGLIKVVVELEWLKDFVKEIMVKYNVLIVVYGIFLDFEKVKVYIEEQGVLIVVKVDGLVLGKGVVVVEIVEQVVEVV